MEQKIPRHAVVGFEYGVTEEDSQLTAICRTKRFYLTLSPSNLHDPKDTEVSKFEREYLQLLDKLKNEKSAELNPGEPDPYEEITYWMVTPLFPVFQSLAPQLPSMPKMQTMHEYFNPPTFFFVLKLVDGTLTPVSESPQSLDYLKPSIEPPQALLDADVPIFNPSNILVAWDHESDGGQYPAKVFGDDNVPYHFKPTHHGSFTNMEREIEVLLRLKQAGLTAKIRVPNLCGYVQAAGQKDVMGLLLTYVDSRDTLSSAIRFRKPEAALRKKWFLISNEC